MVQVPYLEEGDALVAFCLWNGRHDIPVPILGECRKRGVLHQKHADSKKKEDKT